MLTDPRYAKSIPGSDDWGLWSRPRYGEKGAFGGQCQRFACVNLDARWLNELDGRYYCTTCAAALVLAAVRNSSPDGDRL